MDKSSGKEFFEKAARSIEKQGLSGLKEVLAPVFARLGKKQSDGETITLKSIDKWLKQANLLGGKSNITETDTASAFKKVAKSNESINLDQFLEFVTEIAKDKKLDVKNVVGQLAGTGVTDLKDDTKPLSSGAAGANEERKTDTSLNTGSHKERSDEEGRGKGLEGREDVKDSGYVQGFKSKDEDDDETKKKCSGAAACANVERKTDATVQGLKKKDDDDDDKTKKCFDVVGTCVERMTDTSGSHKERFDPGQVQGLKKKGDDDDEKKKKS